MAEAGAAAGDIEHVLGGEAQPVERALRGPRLRDVVIRAEGTERIGGRKGGRAGRHWERDIDGSQWCGRCSCAAGRVTVRRPRL